MLLCNCFISLRVVYGIQYTPNKRCYFSSVIVPFIYMYNMKTKILPCHPEFPLQCPFPPNKQSPECVLCYTEYYIG